MNPFQLSDGVSIPLNTVDILTFIPILVLVGMLFFLSNREMKKSLEQSKIAQDLLLQDRDRLKSRLEESIEELRENRLKRLHELTKAAEFGRLSQGLFHDLMTPLTSMILHTEKLTESGLTHKSLEKAVDASHRMTEYVKEIRATLSHEERERECLLHEELEGVLHLFSHKARKGGVEVHITHTEEIVWRGNPLKLRQIFSNLVSNAVDSFEKKNEENKKVEISITKLGTSAYISVRDNGQGISHKNLPKIFDPFFTTKAFDKGTGIGLTTVRSIVEKDLQGKIEVESTEGRGSTFTITFPVQYIDPVASPQSPHIPPHLG